MGNSHASNIHRTSDDRESAKVYDIRKSEGKGLGLFVTENIKPGEIILCETPLICLSHDTAIEAYDFGKIPRLFNQQSAEVRARYKALTWQHEEMEEYRDAAHWLDAEEDPILWAIWANNSYCDEFNDWALVARDGSRVNHSCVPNATWCYAEKENKFYIRATLEIQTGDEVCVSYISLLEPKEKRQERLKRYEFVCDCAACQRSPDSVQEMHRHRMQALNDILKHSQWQADAGGFDFNPYRIHQLLQASNEIIPLIKQEPSMTFDLMQKLHFRSKMLLASGRSEDAAADESEYGALACLQYGSDSVPDGGA